jgi:hypothetical protein
MVFARNRTKPWVLLSWMVVFKVSVESFELAWLAIGKIMRFRFLCSV